MFRTPYGAFALLGMSAIVQGRQELTELESSEERFEFQNLYSFQGPRLETKYGFTLQAGGDVGYEVVQGSGGEDKEVLVYEKQWVNFERLDDSARLPDDENIQIHAAMCLPDYDINAVQCTLMTWEVYEKVGIDLVSFKEYGTTNLPEIDDEAYSKSETKLKWQLLGHYYDHQPQMEMNADLSWSVRDGEKRMWGGDDYFYRFVGAHTNIDWENRLEATYYARIQYSDETEAWLHSLRNGELYWYGEQYLGYHTEDSDYAPPIARADVQVHISKEGTTSDDSEFRAGTSSISQATCNGYALGIDLMGIKCSWDYAQCTDSAYNRESKNFKAACDDGHSGRYTPNPSNNFGLGARQ